MSVFILENVSKSFKLDKQDYQVLKNINIVFPDKGLVSIVGKSGSGKSTLLNLMIGIDKPTKGKILYKGRNIAKFSDNKFSSYHLNEVSIVFQHYNLLENLTAFENVFLPLKMKGKCRKKDKEKVTQIFKELNIENIIKRKTLKLSGGEKQRVAIARALITEPSVIFCDEPTGALDTENGEEIMKILREKSRNFLIIMVSHNGDLVNKYSDQVIELKDGSIVCENTLKNVNTIEKKRLIKSKYCGRWKYTFIRSNLMKNIIKNIFSFLSCCLGFTALFLCIGFTTGSEKSQSEALMKNLSITYSTISAVETVDLEDSPLTYQKNRRPELYEVDSVLSDFDNLVVDENLSFLISSCPSCSFKDKNQTKFQMIPIYDMSLSNFGSDLLVSGSSGNGDFEEILVNEEFMSLFEDLHVNDKIVYRNRNTITHNTFDEEKPFIQDQINIEKRLKITGIVREFPFLNEPKIYYSYKGAKDYLKAQTMENLSYFLNRRISFYEYLENSENDNEITSYSSVLFLKDMSNCESFFNTIQKLKGTNIEITCLALETKNTYKLFISSFSKTLIVFVAIAFIGINLILGMISLSSFIENRKSTAILTCLGSKNHSIYKIYLIENFLLIGVSFIVSLFLSFYLQKLLNPIISYKFALSNLITIPFENFLGIPYGLILILSAISILFSTIFSLVPMMIYRHGFITDELRDE